MRVSNWLKEACCIMCPKKNPSKLFDLLIRAGVITQEDAKLARDYQLKNPHIMIGEALVLTGLASREVVDAYLASLDKPEAIQIKSAARTHLMRKSKKAHVILREAAAAISEGK